MHFYHISASDECVPRPMCTSCGFVRVPDRSSNKLVSLTITVTTSRSQSIPPLQRSLLFTSHDRLQNGFQARLHKNLHTNSNLGCFYFNGAVCQDNIDIHTADLTTIGNMLASLGLPGLDLTSLVLAAVTLVLVQVFRSWAQTPANLPPFPGRPVPILGHLLLLGPEAREKMLEIRKT
ncbi:hypothetical protein ElyMa_000437600 [Elysia marginata]|uniref:Uncharacterized protein n=1 Tax=Elysia marginata TaxID=1093978 RepID=A0AAV4FN62_9GAST|nr:hypothetical protein ElyMa_000437600 [Elysia marginata]